MIDENSKKIWQCPTCQSEFDKEAITAFIAKLEAWLKDRPSASMDSAIDEVQKVQAILQNIKCVHRNFVRKPTNMMNAQNAIGEANAVSEGKEG